MLTVLFATHNGAGTLPRVLAAYRALQPPPGGYRLVVVDNASTDATAKVLREEGAGLPLLVLECAQRGKNRALNVGLTAVEGDLVVLTDDDILPSPSWLHKLSEAASAHTTFDVFGGHIVADWPQGCPAWIPRLVNLAATYGVTPADQASGPVDSQAVWGGNMAVRRRVFQAGHRFNEDVGPAAGQYAMGSETEFTGRLAKARHSAWFVGEAVVSHIIRPHQLEPDWIVQRAYRLGRGWYRHELPLFPPQLPMVLGVPRWKYREWLDHAWSLARGRLTRDFERTFTARWNLALMKGYFDEAARCRREAKAR